MAELNGTGLGGIGAVGLGWVNWAGSSSGADTWTLVSSSLQPME